MRTYRRILDSDTIGRARVERRGLGLRGLLDLAEQLRCRGLVETGLLLHAEDANRLEDAECTEAIGVCRILRGVERDRHVRHRREVVDFVRLHLLDNPDQVGRIGQVPVMQDKIAMFYMGILVKVIDAIGVEQRRPALDTVDDVILLQQKFGEIGAVLSGDTGYQCNFCHLKLLLNRCAKCEVQ